MIDPSSFGIDQNNFETAIISHHGLERKILLLRQSLSIMHDFAEANFAIVFT